MFFFCVSKTFAADCIVGVDVATFLSSKCSSYSEECSNRGGVNAGSCAEGFGVCCTCKWKFARNCYQITPLIHAIFPIKSPLVAGLHPQKTALTLK